MKREKVSCWNASPGKGISRISYKGGKELLAALEAEKFLQQPALVGFRRLKKLGDRSDQGFFKFSWQFWWVMEDCCLQQEELKKKKVFSKALKNVFEGHSQKIRQTLQEF